MYVDPRSDGHMAAVDVLGDPQGQRAHNVGPPKKLEPRYMVRRRQAARARKLPSHCTIHCNWLRYAVTTSEVTWLQVK